MNIHLGCLSPLTPKVVKTEVKKKKEDADHKLKTIYCK